MCGINGIMYIRGNNKVVDIYTLRHVRDYMVSRGRDGFGEWISPDGTVGLGHRRLAIIDLSPCGTQPMSFGDGRYQIVFNGEIYNYSRLRTDLERCGEVFRSNSDTEVLVAMYARYGTQMFSKLRGMFAFAIWDEVTKSLCLARDPYGIKPIYYTLENNRFCFASQVKALSVDPEVPTHIDPIGLTGFLLWGAVPEPHTIRQSIKLLPAGYYLRIHRDGKIEPPIRYHRFGPSSLTPKVDINTALEQSIEAHLTADVPVAIFLSSGLDSALIAALATRLQSRSQTTITLTFDGLIGTPRDEGPLAALIAQRLRSNHVEHHVVRAEFIDLWAQALRSMDQPSIDGFNTYVISKIAHDLGFKVALSGLGGDELFGGYPSFHDVPKWIRLAKVGKLLPLSTTILDIVATMRKNPKLRGLIRYSRTVEGAYYLRRALYLPEELPAIVGPELARTGLSPCELIRNLSLLAFDVHKGDLWQKVHLLESMQYMRNQLLRDADWASMAHSLELRVPLVDALLREQIAALNFEPARRSGKAAVVRTVAPELPNEIWKRPKTGFNIPVLDWLSPPGQQPGMTRQGMNSRFLALKVLESLDVLPKKSLEFQLV